MIQKWANCPGARSISSKCYANAFKDERRITKKDVAAPERGLLRRGRCGSPDGSSEFRWVPASKTKRSAETTDVKPWILRGRLNRVFSLRSMHVRKFNFSYKFYCAVHETWANFKYFQYIYIHAKILEYNREVPSGKWDKRETSS